MRPYHHRSSLQSVIPHNSLHSSETRLLQKVQLCLICSILEFHLVLYFFCFTCFYLHIILSEAMWQLLRVLQKKRRQYDVNTHGKCQGHAQKWCKSRCCDFCRRSSLPIKSHGWPKKLLQTLPLMWSQYDVSTDGKCQGQPQQLCKSRCCDFCRRTSLQTLPWLWTPDPDEFCRRNCCRHWSHTGFICY